MTPIRTLLAAALFGGLCAAVTLPGAAEEKNNADKKAPNIAKGKEAKEAKRTADAKAVEDVDLAYSLVRYGRKHKSAGALLAAADILIKTPTQEVKEKAKTEKNKKVTAKGEETTETAKAVDDTPKGLLTEAKKMSGDNEHVAALAAALERKIEESRGDVRGPYVNTTTLPGNHNDTYRATFRGGEVAEVAVVGDGGTDVDLFVYDENGNLIAQDIGLTDRAYVRWVPNSTGIFSVRVVNLGFRANRYVIAWN